MKLLNRMERKFGKYAIKHLTMYIILTYAAGYVLLLMSRTSSAYSSVFSYLTLSPSYIMHGQIWRLVSWLLIPPSSLNIFTIVMMICYYQLGTLLERAWGDFLYNFYIFFGLIMTVIAAFILYGVTGIDYGGLFTTYYISLSIFLGFAMTFPDQQMLFMFIIPLKIKYLAYVDIAYLIYTVYEYSKMGWLMFGIPVLVMILCSLASTILFFIMTRNNGRFHPQSHRRKKQFQKSMHGYGTTQRPQQHYTQNGTGKIARHKCAVCGRTELDDPNLEFRFCSKCNGNYEYCQDHLFTHTHVK